MYQIQISRRAREIERQLSPASPQGQTNSVRNFIRAKAQEELESQGHVSSEYSFYAVRNNRAAGSEIAGPVRVALGNYNEKVLYGIAAQPLNHFRLEMNQLGRSAKKLSELEVGSIDYFYESSLLWADVRRLTRFIGISPSITELVNEFLIAQYQLRDSEISQQAMSILAAAFVYVGGASPLDDEAVDRVVDLLEGCGIDPNIFDMERQ